MLCIRGSTLAFARKMEKRNNERNKNKLENVIPQQTEQCV